MAIGARSLIGVAIAVGLIAVVGASGSKRDMEAAEKAGFTDVEEWRKAVAAGFETKEQWNVKLKLDAAERQLQAEARQKELEARQVAEVTKAEACRRDLQCWADEHMIEAASRCRDPIERLAMHSFEWTDGWLEPKFSHLRWLDQQSGALTFIGDKIKFQNGFGAWTFHIYECDFDVNSKSVLAVRARPGRIPN